MPYVCVCECVTRTHIGDTAAAAQINPRVAACGGTAAAAGRRRARWERERERVVKSRRNFRPGFYYHAGRSGVTAMMMGFTGCARGLILSPGVSRCFSIVVGRAVSFSFLFFFWLARWFVGPRGESLCRFWRLWGSGSILMRREAWINDLVGARSDDEEGSLRFEEVRCCFLIFRIVFRSLCFTALVFWFFFFTMKLVHTDANELFSLRSGLTEVCIRDPVLDF